MEIHGISLRSTHDEETLQDKCIIDKGYTALAFDDFQDCFDQVHPNSTTSITGESGVTWKMKDELGAEVPVPPVLKTAKTSKKYKIMIAGSSEKVEKAKATINIIAMYFYDEVTHPGEVHEECHVEVGHTEKVGQDALERLDKNQLTDKDEFEATQNKREGVDRVDDAVDMSRRDDDQEETHGDSDQHAERSGEVYHWGPLCEGVGFVKFHSEGEQPHNVNEQKRPPARQAAHERENGKCEAKVVQGSGSDEEKVDEGTQEPRQEEEVVKVDGSKTFPVMVSPSDKVDDVMRRILNSWVVQQERCVHDVRWKNDPRRFGVEEDSRTRRSNLR